MYKIVSLRENYYSPHWVEVKHGRLCLSKLYGSDTYGPDITLLIVTSFPLYCRHLSQEKREAVLTQLSLKLCE